MPVKRLLISNRGEVAIRIARAARELGVATTGVYSEDDARSPHLRFCDDAVALVGRGPAAYLDAAGIVGAAREAGCDAVHPGYGFLSESGAFARLCADGGITFVGPRPEVLDLFGDKARARSFASGRGVSMAAGTEAASVEDVRSFFRSLGDDAAIAIKAVSGGGGRGMRIVRDLDEIGSAYERCASEALAAFGSSAVYAEQYVAPARHVEVQVIGDAKGNAVHLWERDCSLQRRYQKIVEIAPAPGISPELRARLIAAALELARVSNVDNAATFEFLVDAQRFGEGDAPFWFIEANPRLQVEHTITEEVTGVDIVKAQIRVAGGETLPDLGLTQESIKGPRGTAIQVRVNAEVLQADGSVRPGGGTIGALAAPSGPGIRLDHCAYAGTATNPAFDSLLAKLIVHAPAGGTPDSGFTEALAKCERALDELAVEGVRTNIDVLRGLVADPRVRHGALHTTLVEELAPTLAADNVAPQQSAGLAGIRLASNDPLAVLEHGKSGGVTSPAPETAEIGDGRIAVRAPIQGTIISIDVREGDVVPSGARLFVMEAMKMEHLITTEQGGRVERILVSPGDAVFEGHILAVMEALDVAGSAEADSTALDLDAIRPDLAEVHERHEIGMDAARSDAVERMHTRGQRTARENISALCDDGSFVEYGPLVIAAQRRRRELDDLIRRTPADGLVAGVGTVNADRFGAETSRVIAMSYDYTVLAGTQGQQNHRKKDRMFELAEKHRLPIVFFTEGGGGRPGDTDGVGVAGLDCMAFNYFGGLSGLVPLVGVVSGPCFAGNAALLGCCDVVIAAKDSNIGMGGPAMIEGGGLGVFRPDEIGPASVQAANGVIDVLVENDAEGVEVARKYLSYFQGETKDWECVDQRLLRSIIPENRRRMYDVRRVIELLADSGSVLELRRGFGPGMVTALVRIEGKPVGLVANNPAHLAGAIDSDGADKAARFMQLCDAFDLPLLFLCDTPGIMVGPEAEKTALVRHASRMFVTSASVTVPVFTIILRKAYGLGAQAMAGGSFKAPFFTVSWPTGEFGGMGLEGAVKLGYRNELAAIDDPDKRREVFEEMVERMYRHGKAVNTASHFEIDDVIDPLDSRRWVTAGLRSVPSPAPRTEKKRPNIDTW